MFIDVLSSLSSLLVIFKERTLGPNHRQHQLHVGNFITRFLPRFHIQSYNVILLILVHVGSYTLTFIRVNEAITFISRVLIEVRG